MHTFSKGQKSPLSQITSAQQCTVALKFQNPRGLTLDATLFGVDAKDQLSDEAFFVFYNHPQSPAGALKLLPGQAGELQRFQVDLTRLPAHIKKLVFTISIDGNGTMQDLTEGEISFLAGNQQVFRYLVKGTEFKTEKALIFLEVYFKDQWRVGAVGQGFSGGLSQLLKFYGGVEESTPAVPPASPVPPASSRATPSPAPTPPAAQKPSLNLSKGLALEKRVSEHKDASYLINLVKTVNIVLEKHGASDIVAQVVMVMDHSGSMTHAYQKGVVQQVVERLAVVAMRLDDNASLEAWFYADKFMQTEDITLDNIKNYVKDTSKKRGTGGTLFPQIGFGNNEPPIMRELVRTHGNSPLPVLVLFITDGGIDKGTTMAKILKESSHLPIFWQFIGISGGVYDVLEKLDTVKGRVVDNANFFALDDLKKISDEELFRRMLVELPVWLKAAKEKGIVAREAGR